MYGWEDAVSLPRIGKERSKVPVMGTYRQHSPHDAKIENEQDIHFINKLLVRSLKRNDEMAARESYLNHCN